MTSTVVPSMASCVSDDCHVRMCDVQVQFNSWFAEQIDAGCWSSFVSIEISFKNSKVDGVARGARSPVSSMPAHV